MKPKKLTICGWGPYKAKEEVDFTIFEEKGVFRFEILSIAAPPCKLY